MKLLMQPISDLVFKLIILLFFIISCQSPISNSSNIYYFKNGYNISLAKPFDSFQKDSNRVYIGDPELLSLKDSISGSRLDIYLGFQDPISDWKYVFNFNDSIFSLEKQVRMAHDGIYISSGLIKCHNLNIPYVQFSRKFANVIESKFYSKYNLIINLEFTNKLGLEYSKQLKLFEDIICSFDINAN